MIDSLDNTTKDVLHALTIAMNNELQLNKDEILQLEKKMDQTPNSTVIEHKYSLSMIRYDQLKRINQELLELGREILYKEKRPIKTLEVF